MSVISHRLLAAAALAGLLGACAAADKSTQLASAGQDDNHPGKAAYDTWCGTCHTDEADGDAPSTESIRRLSKANIEYQVTLGYMAEIAREVPRDELRQIIEWTPLNPVDAGGWTRAAACPANERRVDLSASARRVATTFGIDDGNSRSQSAAETGLTRADMPNLELAWSIAFPQTATMRSQPVIVGDTIFIAATDSGHLYALDTETGCVKWTYASDLTLRSSLTFAEATRRGPASIIMGDAGGRVHAVDARNGRKLWVADVKLNNLNRITGAPVVHDGVVYTPLSAIEVNYAGPDAYECCKGQGALVANDLATGRRIWIGRTMEEAQPTILGKTGVQQWGPSGAIIWASPIIDAERRQVIVGTGENTSWPATETSDAIIAYDMATGARKWVFQATKADIWNYACGRRGANCDWPGEYQSPDHDFGATPMLVTLPNGTDMVIAGQKSGVVWALDPDTGELKWSNKIGRGSAGGGMRWGLAYDGRRIFAPQNDPAGQSENPNWGPGLTAMDATSGEILWNYKPNARDCGQDFPVAQATRPPAEWRIQPIAAPVLPPARTPAAAAAGRSGTGGGQGAAPGRAATPPPAVAAAAPAGPRPARCRVGMAAAPLLVDGAVVTGTNGGMLRIFDPENGAVLFEYQTNRPYPNTVNGVEGQGGGLDSAPYVAGAGALFVQSGYARFGQPPGNVLLAFRPRR